MGKTPPYSFKNRDVGKHPHGRGEDQRSKLIVSDELGNTPTGVGKTLSADEIIALCEKHPHGRGEDRL